MQPNEKTSVEDLKAIVAAKAPVCLSKDNHCKKYPQQYQFCGPCRKTHRALALLSSYGIILSSSAYVAISHAHAGEDREVFDNLATKGVLFKKVLNV
jgi:hypothetical protein